MLGGGGAVVNLIGREHAGPPRPSLAGALDPDRRAALDVRLADARRWWARLDATRPVAGCARTPALEPALEEDAHLAALDAALVWLADRRARALAALPADGDGAASPEVRGRLVVCEIDGSIGGGEAEAASRGLFDVDDRPPWDLWLVAYGRTRSTQPDDPIRCLVAWLPEPWWALADAAIAACPTRCVYWAD
jgi:hypothetical protein